MIATDPLFADESVQHAIGLQRYRADYLARDLWRLGRGRLHWSHVVKSRGDGGVVVVGGGALGDLKAAYVDVIVPAHARLGVEDHQLRLWRGSLRRVRKTLKRPEEDAFEEFLHKERFSSVFRVVGAHVRRNEGASEELARAVLKMMAAVQLRADERG